MSGISLGRQIIIKRLTYQLRLKGRLLGKKTLAMSLALLLIISFASFASALPETTFSGTLTDSAGNPIQDVAITLTAADGTTSSAVTDGSGNYSVEVTPDDYALELYPNSHQAIVGNMADYTLRQKNTYPIDLTHGSVVQNIQLHTATLHVTVEDTAGNPLPNIPVTALTRDGYQYGGGTTSLYENDPGATIVLLGSGVDGAQVSTGGDGVADVTSLVGTRYGTDYNEGSLCAEIFGAQTCITQPLNVSGDTDVIIQQKNVGTTFSGTLTDSTNSPVQDAVVTLTATDDTVASATTDSNGYYSMDAIPRNYSLKVYQNSHQAIVGNLADYTLQQ
jgi:hypothetical protein